MIEELLTKAWKYLLNMSHLGLAAFLIPFATLSPPARKSKAISRPNPEKLVQTSSQSLQAAFANVDTHTTQHLRKVLSAFHEHKLSPHHFNSLDGYGHSDHGRDTIDDIYASIFEAEAACVRIQFMSGTHAIASVLFGCLRHGDEMLSVAGPVYDTLEEVIGLRGTPGRGSLRDMGVSYDEVPLLPDGTVDFESISGHITPRTKLIFIQRSFGYSWRPPLSNATIARIVKIVKSIRRDIVCFVDNCYGEFVEAVEPVHPSIGADAMAGSLIKNLGGGIAPSGAYVVGSKEIVEKARCRLAAPGVGGGATLGWQRTLFQGLYLAPQCIGEALKSSLLIADVMHELGYQTNPAPRESSFVRAVRLGNEQRVMDFCRCVQTNGPVGAHFNVDKGMTEGYGVEVVFAQATFIDGSTSEMSADAPLREPYVAFAQGGGFWGAWVPALEDIVRTVGWCQE